MVWIKWPGFTSAQFDQNKKLCKINDSSQTCKILIFKIFKFFKGTLIFTLDQT